MSVRAVEETVGTYVICFLYTATTGALGRASEKSCDSAREQTATTFKKQKQNKNCIQVDGGRLIFPMRRSTASTKIIIKEKITRVRGSNDDNSETVRATTAR